MKAVILAGGFATRLKGVTSRQKVLSDIGGRTILDHQVGLLRRGGVTHITLSLHHGADAVREYAKRFGAGVDTVYEVEPLGTGGAARYATRGLREPIMVLNGDIVGDLDVAAFWEQALANRTHTLALVPSADKDLGNVELLGDRIIAFQEKTPNAVLWSSWGAYMLFPGIFEYFPDKFSIEKECFPKLATRGILRAYFQKGRFLDIGTPERFERRFGVI